MNQKCMLVQICLLLALMLPAAVEAQFTFTTNADNTITITGYTGSNGVVTIPDTLNGLPVTSIGNWTFADRANLTSVTIPSGVTSIGDNAFRCCYKLSNVAIPTSVTNIGTCSFYDCTSLTNIVLPPNVTSIGMVAFGWCSSLASITIPNGVTNIGQSTFDGCIQLTNIAFSSGTTIIGPLAFDHCSGLSRITLPNSLNRIDDDAFAFCTKLTEITIPSNVTTIGSRVFQSCSNLVNVTILGGTYVGTDMFLNCIALSNINLPQSLTSFGGEPFESCSSLTNITIPSGVTNLWEMAFAICPNLKGVFFKGNAPTWAQAWDEAMTFLGSTNVIAYYLPGTTGWSNSLAGRPAVLWNPTFQIANTSFGRQNNQFNFTVNGTAGIPVVIEACTNMSVGSWVPLRSVNLTNGAIPFSDSLNCPGRFYRLRSP